MLYVNRLYLKSREWILGVLRKQFVCVSGEIETERERGPEREQEREFTGSTIE